MTDKVQTIKEKIPVKCLEKIQKGKANQRKASQQVFEAGRVVGAWMTRLQEVNKQLSSAEASIKANLQDAHKKMKLDKKVEYQFQFDGNDSFVGVLKPKPKS